MEFKVRSLESILAKIAKEQSDAGKWNGEKRGFWQWKNYFISLLQEEKIYHWFDGRSALVPYPREPFYRRSIGLFQHGDTEWIRDYQKEERMRDVDSQKAISMLRKNLGPVPLGLILPTLNNRLLSEPQRVICSLKELGDYYARFEWDVMGLIKTDVTLLPVAETTKDLGTLIHLINHFDEELSGIHPEFKMTDVQKKIDLTQKISRKFVAMHLEIVKNYRWTFADVQDLCERYQHISGPEESSSMVASQSLVTFVPPCSLISRGDHPDGGERRNFQEDRKFPSQDREDSGRWRDRGDGFQQRG